MIELLVAGTIALGLLGLILSTLLGNRNLLSHDLVKTRLNQNLRSALDIIGINVREAGENLLNTFPAILIENGADGAPDELVLRRSLIEEVLNLCTQIDGGTGVTQIDFAIPGTQSGCIYSDNTTNYNSWAAYRNANDGVVDAYIYDVTSRQGEFFQYTSENDSGSGYSISRSAGNWANTYLVGSSSVHIIEEWRLRLNDQGVLELIQNGDDTNILNIVDGISDFQVSAMLEDGSSVNQFTNFDDWSQIRHVEVTLAGTNTIRGRQISNQLTSRYFPRNILSN